MSFNVTCECGKKSSFNSNLHGTSFVCPCGQDLSMKAIADQLTVARYARYLFLLTACMAGFELGNTFLAQADPVTHGTLLPFIRAFSWTLRLLMGGLIVRALHPFGKPIASLTFVLLLIEPLLSVISGFGVALLLSRAFRNAGFSSSLIGVSRSAITELQGHINGSDESASYRNNR